MEGFMDVIAAYRAGIENAVASMGTALSREHVEHLKRLTKKLVLVYDGDKAGQAATLKALDEIGDMPVQIVSMPDNLDPDEYLQKMVQKTWPIYNETRISPIEFYIHQYKPENSENLQAQIEFIEKNSSFDCSRKSLSLLKTAIFIF